VRPRAPRALDANCTSRDADGPMIRDREPAGTIPGGRLGARAGAGPPSTRGAMPSYLKILVGMALGVALGVGFGDGPNALGLAPG